MLQEERWFNLFTTLGRYVISYDIFLLGAVTYAQDLHTSPQHHSHFLQGRYCHLRMGSKAGCARTAKIVIDESQRQSCALPQLLRRRAQAPLDNPSEPQRAHPDA